MDKNVKISDIISAKQDEQRFFLDNLMNEVIVTHTLAIVVVVMETDIHDSFIAVWQEQLQKEAVEMLLMQRDARHSRVRGHISLVERELAQLTQLEVEQRQLRANLHMVSTSHYWQMLHIASTSHCRRFTLPCLLCITERASREATGTNTTASAVTGWEGQERDRVAKETGKI